MTTSQPASRDERTLKNAPGLCSTPSVNFFQSLAALRQYGAAFSGLTAGHWERSVHLFLKRVMRNFTVLQDDLHAAHLNLPRYALVATSPLPGAK